MAHIRSTLEDGLLAVYEGVIEALRKLEPEAKLRLMEPIVDIVGRRAQSSTSLKLSGLIEIRALVSDIPKTTENQQKLVQWFLRLFTDCK
jgi:hypothetical protein